MDCGHSLWHHIFSWDPSLLDTVIELQALCDEESIWEKPLREVSGPAYRTDQVSLASSGTSQSCLRSAPPSLASPHPPSASCALCSPSPAMATFIPTPHQPHSVCLHYLSCLQFHHSVCPKTLISTPTPPLLPIAHPSAPLALPYLALSLGPSMPACLHFPV